MEIKTQTTIICPHCGAELELDIEAKAKENDVPTPEPKPLPDDGQDETKGRISFEELLGKFNGVLSYRGYKTVETDMGVYGYLHWAYYFADGLLKDNAWMFRPSTYPLIYDYRGNSTEDSATGYNAMQAWMMASELAELVPDKGETYNTQTRLFLAAYELGGDIFYPLYNNKTMTANPYAMREAASIIYAIARGDKNQSEQIENYREELGGQPIPASCWEDLGYENEKLFDEEGHCIGYRTKSVGYCINADMFIPDAPGPHVDGTTVCDLDWPWDEGQPEHLFNKETGNYDEDECINQFYVDNYNMMSQTSLNTWNSYPIEKQNRLINVAAIPPCTLQYMFTKRNVRFDGIQHKTYDGNVWADYFCFSETDEDTGLRLEGPFADLKGMVRYNAIYAPNARETGIMETARITDNLRWTLMDPNYGRCRPGCRPTIEGGELNPVSGSPENEIYNVDLTTMVADNDEERASLMRQDGFPSDSPRSYVSGHSAQIWMLALLFTQFNNDKTPRPETWVRKAYEYSVNRTIGRFHWNSDIIYGRLFGAMALPLINAMSGLKENLEAIREFVLNPDQEPEPDPQPQPQGDIRFNVVIGNLSEKEVVLNGDLALLLANPDSNGQYYGWEGCYNRTGHIRFSDDTVRMASGEALSFENISAENSEVVVRGRSLLDPERLPEAGWPSNVLLYNLDGKSDKIVPMPLQPWFTFEDGTTLHLTIV